MKDRKVYMRQYWHKNKEKLKIRNRVRYILNRDYLLAYKRAKWKRYWLESMLWEYAKHKYFKFIQQENPLGRMFREESLFTKEDLLYIKELWIVEKKENGQCVLTAVSNADELKDPTQRDDFATYVTHVTDHQK